MKTIKKVVLILIFSVAGSQLATSQNWDLVWQDEFTNGISPDWVFETGTGSNGWGNNELQYYRQQNASVVNGELVITARNENFGGMNYTSTRMKTQGRKSWKYGKIEARIKMPSFSGSWPAFWMLGDNISSVGWPACGEIDIMEHVNTEGQTHGTLHWQDHNNSYASFTKSRTNNSVTDYHVYTIEWDESAIKWFLDGNLYHEANISGGVNGTQEFHNNFFILLNFAIGGNWPGFNIDNNALPASMSVDYVRVYKKGTGNPNPTGPVTLYQHCPYTGYAIGLSEGSYTLGQLQALGIANDAISSIKVQAGYKATLYWDDNFQGTTLVKTGDDDCLGDDGFNDKMSSIVISQNTSVSNVIEAESYINMSGVQLENCSEGGQNVGYIDTGNWMAYTAINIPSSGNYRIEYRVASAVDGGILSADLNAGANVLGQVNIPNTGGWQNWTTVSHTMYINAGSYPFGLYAQNGGWNINWIKINNLGAAKTAINNTNPSVDINFEKHLGKIQLYPNPAVNELNITGITKNTKVSIIDLSGNLIKSKGLNNSTDSATKIDVSSLNAGIYLIKIEVGNYSELFKFIKE